MESFLYLMQTSVEWMTAVSPRLIAAGSVAVLACIAFYCFF